MNNEEYYPVLLFPCVVKNGKATFKTISKSIEVSAPIELINDILSLCDGTRSFDSVVNELKNNWDESNVHSFAQKLSEVGVLVDSRSVSSYVWEFVKNPNAFYHELTDESIRHLIEKSHARCKYIQADKELHVQDFHLKKYLEKRKSTRCFSDSAVAENTIAMLLWASYGMIDERGDPSSFRKVVPSAGGLYPLHISLVLLKGPTSSEFGVFDVEFTKSNCIGLSKKTTHITEILSSFIDYEVLRSATGIIIISGAFHVHEEKYCNRAILYTPIEAGHAAQNVHLAASELNLGTVEIGGFKEDLLKKALRLNDGYTPLTTIVFGYPIESPTHNQLIHHDIESRWINSVTDEYTLPFSMVFSRTPGADNRDWSCGRDQNPTTAYSKAVSEAYEWRSCGMVPDNLVFASYKELSNAIHPHSLIRYHPDQYNGESFPFVPFDDSYKYRWTTGYDISTSQSYLVLADCVYFPYHTDRYYTYANSTGTSAFPTFEKAIEIAALEIIERDAFMVAWLNRLQMPKIHLSSLQESAQSRIKMLSELGYIVHIMDFTLDLAPVVFVFAQNKQKNYTVCAASCSFNVEDAVDHALMEVESSIHCKRIFPERKTINPIDVHYTSDHGVLYEQAEYFSKADFLISGAEHILLSDIGKNASRNWSELIESIYRKGSKIIAVELSDSGLDSNNRHLHVAKVFIPGLVPMSFGYGQEPFGMDRIYDIPIRLNLVNRRVDYDSLTKFPHPFT